MTKSWRTSQKQKDFPSGLRSREYRLPQEHSSLLAPVEQDCPAPIHCSKSHKKSQGRQN